MYLKPRSAAERLAAEGWEIRKLFPVSGNTGRE